MFVTISRVRSTEKTYMFCAAETMYVKKSIEDNRMDDEKKKVKQAIALEYDPSDEAPRVIASGKGILAEKIIEKAQESSVPIHRDDKLADTLSRLDIGEMIPPELYEVVAEILVFVDAVDHRMVKESVANGGKHKG